MLRHLALVLLATAAFAAETVPAASAKSAAATCSPIAAEQVPAAAKAALVQAGVDVAKLASCTKDGVVRYCGAVTGADGKSAMIEVDAAGKQYAAASDDGCGGCCAPAAK